MARRSAAGLGLAALAIVAAVAWWLVRGDGDGTQASAADPTGSAAGGTPAAMVLPDAAPEAAPDALWPGAASDEAGPAGSGRSVLVVTLVHDDDGTPIPDASIQVLAKITETDPRRGTRTEALTGADGSLRVEFEHGVQVWLVRALPGDGHAKVELRPELDIARGATERIELRAPRGAVVRGMVVDEAGAAVPLAGVMAWCDMRWNLEHGDDPVPEPDRHTVCDGAGRFELRGLGPQLVLMPEAQGLAPVRGVAGPVADAAQVDAVTLVLGPALELRGRVIDPDGRPVVSVSVRADRSSLASNQAGLDPARPLKHVQRTDVDGRFALAPLATGNWNVTVIAPGYQPWLRALRPDGTELLIQLSTGLSLAGLVLSADGAPLDGADVQLGGASQDEFDQETTSTQTVAGRFAFETLLPTQSATLGVSAPGHALLVRESLVVEDGAAPLELRLESERPIAGRVVDEHDQPVSGAEVTARGDRRIATGYRMGTAWEDWFWPRVTWAHTDLDGRFRLERLYDGTFELSVDDPRHEGLLHTQTLRSGAEDLLIRLDAAALRRAVLTGRVVDALSGAPLDDFMLWLEPLDPERRVPGTILPMSQFQDSGGAFSLQGIEPGLWRPVVDAEGYSRTADPDLDLREGEQQIEIEVRPARTLWMRLLDQRDTPVHGAFVEFEDLRGQRIELEAQPVGVDSIGMTDKSGELTAHGLPADRLVVVLRLRLVSGAPVPPREFRLPVDLLVQPEGVQEFRIERPRLRCLVLTLRETDESLPQTVFDTGDEAGRAAAEELAEQQTIGPLERPVVVTVTAADGELVDTARCEPEPDQPSRYRVSSSVSASETERTSWLAAALPSGASRAVISCEGFEAVTLELPAGEGHVRRTVILRPASR